MTDITDGVLRVDYTGCETHVIDAPIRKGAVLLCGYGLSFKFCFEKWRTADPYAEIWSLNGRHVSGETRHFQIHTPERAASIDYLRNFKPESWTAKGCPVVTCDNYPFDKIRRRLLCSTADYMLALADLEGFARVYMPGLDYGGTRDPREVYASRYWIGVLEGKGALVFRSPFSRMFEEDMYR